MSKLNMTKIAKILEAQGFEPPFKVHKVKKTEKTAALVMLEANYDVDMISEAIKDAFLANCKCELGDEGIGDYEFQGQKGRQVDMQWSCEPQTDLTVDVTDVDRGLVPTSLNASKPTDDGDDIPVNFQKTYERDVNGRTIWEYEAQVG